MTAPTKKADALADVTPAEAAILRVQLQKWFEEKQQEKDPSKLSPLEWAKANATIVLPTEGRQAFVPYSYQEALLEDASPRRLILKARQTGISNTIAIEALHKTITRPDTTELLISRSQKAASELITYCQRTISGLKQLPKLIRENQTEIAFANNSRIVSLSAGPNAARSLAATDLYLDEFAFTSYDAQIYESAMGTISTGGSMTVLSTANGRANMFYRLWQGLEGGEWSRHRIHWSDCPRYDAAWEQKMRASMTRQSFAQEYDLDFATSGDAVFEIKDLARCKDGYEPNGPFEEYVTAWDLGRKKDWTVGVTWGRIGDDWHLAEYQRCQDDFPVVGGMIATRVHRFSGTHAVESNGIGDPIIQFLDVDVEQFTTTQKSKIQAIQALQLLLQQGRLKHENEQLDRELNLYQWRDEGLLTDSVMASAIAAFYVIDTGVTEFF